MPLGAIQTEQHPWSGLGVLGGLLAKNMRKDPAQELAKARLNMEMQKFRGEETAKGSLKTVLDSADFSTQESSTKFVLDFVKGGGKVTDAVAIAKQANPKESGLLDWVSKNSPQTEQGQPTQPQQTPLLGQQPVEPAQDPLQALQPQQSQQPLETQKPPQQTPPEEEPFVHPAVRHLPYNNVTDGELYALKANVEDKPMSEMAGTLLDERDRARVAYNANRKYATDKTKKYVEKMSDKRQSAEEQKFALQNMKWGLENRDPETSRSDFWASRLPLWGSRFVSPEGALIESAVKTYLISDLGSFTGQKNVFIEKRLMSALLGLDKSDAANYALMYGLQLKNEKELAADKIFNDISAQYEDMKSLGHIPENIERMVKEQMKPIEKDLEKQYGYKLRELQENEEELDKLVNKKVSPGTVLTEGMMDKFSRKYGVDKGEDMAIKFGYTIPTEAETKRYKQ